MAGLGVLLHKRFHAGRDCNLLLATFPLSLLEIALFTAAAAADEITARGGYLGGEYGGGLGNLPFGLKTPTLMRVAFGVALSFPTFAGAGSPPVEDDEGSSLTAIAG